MQSSYKRARKLVQSNRKKLVALAEAVLKKEVLEADEIDVIVNGSKRVHGNGKKPSRKKGETAT